MRSRRTRVRFPPPPRMLRGDREHRWRCTDIHVAVVDRPRPSYGVAHPDARRLWTRPELEVLRSVVVSNAVDVVDRFSLDEMPPKQLLRHQDVFEHVGAPSRPWVVGDSHHDVAGFVSRTPPFQFPLASPTSVLQPPHVSDLACFAFPQAHRSLALQAGHRRCRLEGWKVLPHSLHCLSRMTDGISGVCQFTSP